KTLANLWTRLRSPRPNRASGGYLLTGTSASREDELLGVTGRRTRPSGVATGVGVASTRREQEEAAAEAGGSWRNANECLINVTDFSDIEAAVTVTATAAAAAAQDEEEHEEELTTTATTVTELRVPSITTTNIHNISKNISSNNNNIGNSNSNNIGNSNNNNNNNNNNSSNSNNMSRIVQPRYRFRDLLLGDFSFNDDGER
ncbi:hypothetical protein KR222_002423, partial [Zaprionus bogoriensis]